MKIGLITFHDTTNFGSLLQTYGLYKKVRELGFDIDVIDYQCESIVRREIPRPFNLLQSPPKIIKDLLIGSITRCKYRALSQFLHDNMTLSPICNKYTISKIFNNYDKLIVGSDIVWGMDITENDLTYFLDSETNRYKKNAFSSSIGNPWSEQDKMRLRPLLVDFNYIAVREDESADWVEELIGKRPDVVCDPTMLISSEEWLKYTYHRKDKNTYVLVYFDNANSDCLSSAISFAKAHHLKVKYINYGLPKRGAQNIKPTSLEDFLSLINDAAEVVTASYHGMLFSIYFNKQFIYFNRAHKSRMNSLARRLNVLDRNGEGKDILQIPEIDYSSINKSVETYRAYSIKCLKELLQS